MAADRTKALTTPHRIKPTSTNRHSAWRPNPGRRSTYRGGDSVQTTGTGSYQVQNGRHRRDKAIAADRTEIECPAVDSIGPTMIRRSDQCIKPHAAGTLF